MERIFLEMENFSTVSFNLASVMIILAVLQALGVAFLMVILLKNKTDQTKDETPTYRVPDDKSDIDNQIK